MVFLVSLMSGIKRNQVFLELCGFNTMRFLISLNEIFLEAEISVFKHGIG